MVAMPKQNVPALRLEGFSGEWELKAIGELFAERNESFPEGELLSVTLRNGIKRFQEIGRHNTSNEDKSKYKLVEVGDIAYNSMRMWQGASGVSPWKGIVSPAYTVLKPVGSQDTPFFAYYFKTPFMIQVFQLNSQGLTSDTWNLKYPALSAIDICRPQDIEEQQAIGAIFTNLDAAINQHTLKHKALQQAKTALMQRMFPQEGQTVPELRLEGFSGEWKTASIGAVSALHNGRDYKHLGEGCIPVYGTGGYMAAVDQALSHDKDAVGIGRKGTINKPYILKAPFWTVDTLFYVVPNQDTDLAFFYASVLRVDWMAKNTATGLPSLTSQAINSADISVPPTLEEQQAIGAVFTNLDQLIAAEAQYIASLKQAKTALLQRMFI